MSDHTYQKLRETMLPKYHELTDKQYQALSLLFHEYNEAFYDLPVYYRDLFFDRLYGKS